MSRKKKFHIVTVDLVKDDVVGHLEVRTRCDRPSQVQKVDLATAPLVKREGAYYVNLSRKEMVSPGLICTPCKNDEIREGVRAERIKVRM